MADDCRLLFHLLLRVGLATGSVAVSVAAPAAAEASEDEAAVAERAEVADRAAVVDRDERAFARVDSPALGLPPVPIPENNRPTVEKIALGRKLFFDRRLSVNNTMSCGMCHVPEQGFTSNELATPVGVHGRSVKRNAPTVLNSAYLVRVFHDGRETSLETQVLSPLLAHNEMANPSIGWLVAKLTRLPDYEGWFERAFNSGPSVEAIGQAIASWERTLLAGDTPFDRWRYGGDEDALTATERAGFALFSGKAGCAACHLVEEDYALFTDHQFHDTGSGYRVRAGSGEEERPVRVAVAPGVVIQLDPTAVRSVGRPRPTDLGRFEVTQNPDDRWRFRTPSLRNVAITAPYMHDGALGTLEEVVRFYDRGGIPHPGLDARIRPLGLSAHEIGAVVAFLQTLTSPRISELQADARSVAIGN